ncbi:hypothetical protein BJX96DRAFT_180319 [Aspergillus floccosus]
MHPQKPQKEIEEEILERQHEIPHMKSSFLSLYRYASARDIALVLISAICAIIAGATQLLPTIVFAEVAAVLADVEDEPHVNGDKASVLRQYTLYLVYMAIEAFITQYIATAGFVYTGERITRKIKEKYLGAVLRQNMAIFVS